MRSARETSVSLELEAAYGDRGTQRRRRPEGERSDDLAALLFEECVRDVGCRRALYVGVDPGEGSLVVRHAYDLEPAIGGRIPLDDEGELAVRAVLEGRAVVHVEGDLPAGFPADRWQPPGAILAVPLACAPLLGSPEGEVSPRCDLYRPDLNRPQPCWRERSPTPGAAEWPVRIRRDCPGCWVFGATGVFVFERERPFEALEIERLEWRAREAGTRMRAHRAVERLEQAAAELKDERQWLDTVMVSAADPIIVTDEAGRLIQQNRRAEEILVADSEDSAGKRRAIEINDIMFSAYLSSLGMDPHRAPREIPLVSPVDGSDMLFEAISTPAMGAGGDRRGVVTVLRDITDLQKATQELLSQVHKAQRAEFAIRQERDRLNMIVQSAVEPIVVTNLENEIVLTNGEGERLFQTGPADSPERMRAVRLNDASFSSFLTEFLADARAHGKRELRLRDPSNEENRSYDVTAGKVHDERGQTVAVVSVFHDLTRLRELERRRIEQRLFESEKLAATGRLAASIAHEMNNPLESIKNALYIVKADVEPQDAGYRFLEIAQKECDRVGNIIKQFLGIYRPAVSMLPVDLERVLEDELKLLENQLHKREIEIVRSFGGVPPVVASEDQLKQVFLNLILNAMEAMTGGGSLVVTTRFHERPVALSSIAPSVWVTIADTGPGISAEHMGNLFEPFFTTKSEKGTGLGLWVSYGIIKSHQGDIQVESLPGSGTKFHVIFPHLPQK